MIDLGYSIEDFVFNAEECDLMVDAINNGSKHRSRAGFRNLMSLESVARIAADERLLSIIHDICGNRLIPFKATLFNKTSKANWLVSWHQDTVLPVSGRFEQVGWGPWTTKAGIMYAHAPFSVLSKILALRVQLDPCDEFNGPLRVIERSHEFGVLSGEALMDRVRGGREQICLAGQGSVIAMRPLLVHASSKIVSDKPRRVLHIEYAETLELGNGFELAFS